MSLISRNAGVPRRAALIGLIVFLWVIVAPAVPAAGAIYYVSTDGNDTNAGTSSKLAWRTITHAAKVAKAGDLVRIKAGNYGYEKVVIKNSGTAEAPIRFEGHDGEVILDGMTKESKEKMEQTWKKEGASLKKRGATLSLKGSGMTVRGSHIKISGITVRRCGAGIMVHNGFHHVTVEGCTASMCSWAGIILAGHDSKIRRCTGNNCGMGNIWLSGHDNTAADCWSYCDPNLCGIMPGVDTATDYCYVAANARNVHFMRCRGDGRIQSGHGLCFAAGSGRPKIDPGCSNSRATDCEMYNCWELFGARHKSHDITFVNCYGESNGRKYYDHGFYYRTGAQNITVKNCRVRGLMHGLHADDAGGRWKDWGVTRNITYENCIATHCTHGIRMNAPNTKVVNCISAQNKYGVTMGNVEGLSLKDCIICRNEVGIQADFPTTEIVSRCNVWDNKTNFGRKAKPGAGCISEDPQFVTVGGSRKIPGPDRDNWHLKETSPCKDMGPYATDPKAPIGMR